VVRYAKILVPFFVIVPALLGFANDETHPVITAAPAALAAGQYGMVTVTVDHASSTDTTLYITTSNPSDLSVPSTVDLPAGATQVQFQISASGVGSGTVSASANGSEATSSPIMVESID
jgi:hypothetical protein